MQQVFSSVFMFPGACDETWENPFGAKRYVRDHYNQLSVSLRERFLPGRQLDLIFRAYDEGAAFRYFLPRQEAFGEFVISSENTGFYFPQDVFAYALNLGSFTTPYEAHFDRVNLAQIKPTSIVGLPLLVEFPQGPWAALLEADLTDYAGMYVSAVYGVSNALMSKLSPMPGFDASTMGTYIGDVDTESDLEKTWKFAQEAILISSRRRGDQLGSEDIILGKTPKATPWRVIMVHSRPGGLIESNYLILNLSPPCALADTSWIKPGKAAWDWLSGRLARGVDFEPGMNTATLKHYVDFAADHHLVVDFHGAHKSSGLRRTYPNELAREGVLAAA